MRGAALLLINPRILSPCVTENIFRNQDLQFVLWKLSLEQCIDLYRPGWCKTFYEIMRKNLDISYGIKSAKN
jgi:hypothetical protein